MRLPWNILLLLMVWVSGCQPVVENIRPSEKKDVHPPASESEQQLREYAEQGWKRCPACADPGEVPLAISRLLQDELKQPRLRGLLAMGARLNAASTKEEGLQVLQEALAASATGAVVSPAATLDSLIHFPIASELTLRERSTANLELGRLFHKGAPGEFTERVEAMLKPLIGDNAASTEPVGILVRDMLHRGRLQRDKNAHHSVRRLCRALLDDNRPLQARECVIAGGGELERPDELLFEIYARMPSIDREDIETNVRVFDSSLTQISQCFEGQRSEWTWSTPRGSRGNPWVAALYLRLAESATEDAELECFLGQAAYHCMRDILEGGTCSVPWAIGRYCLLESRNNPRRYIELVDAIFIEKLGLYDRLYNDPSAQVQEALLQLHISLAHLYVSGVAQGPEPWKSVNYHVWRASVLWREMHPGEALGEDFFRLLPDRCSDLKVRTQLQLEECLQRCPRKRMAFVGEVEDPTCARACRNDEVIARSRGCWGG